WLDHVKLRLPKNNVNTMSDAGSNIVLLNSVVGKTQQLSPKTSSACVRLGRTQHLPPEKPIASVNAVKVLGKYVKQRTLRNDADTTKTKAKITGSAESVSYTECDDMRRCPATLKIEACKGNVTCTSTEGNQHEPVGSLASASKTEVEGRHSPLPAEDGEHPLPGMHNSTSGGTELLPPSDVVHQASELSSTTTDNGSGFLPCTTTAGRPRNQLTVKSLCLLDIALRIKAEASSEPTKPAKHTSEQAYPGWMQLVSYAAVKKQFQCCFCPFGTKDSRLLLRHLDVQACLGLYQCQHCTETFHTKYARTRHAKKAHVLASQSQANEKPFSCHLCSKAFHSKDGWSSHVRLHTGVGLHKCTVCQIACTSPGNLVIHMRKHTGEKPFKCDHCPRCFAAKKQLVNHTRMHTGEKPYSCKLCPATYRVSTSLSAHKRKRHKKGPCK
ncbi:unnamed protein product, partial [Ixodes hexagonus]